MLRLRRSVWRRGGCRRGDACGYGHNFAEVLAYRMSRVAEWVAVDRGVGAEALESGLGVSRWMGRGIDPDAGVAVFG